MRRVGIVEFIESIKFTSVLLFLAMMNYPAMSQELESETREIAQDSSQATPPSSVMNTLDSLEEFVKSIDWSSIIPPLSSMGMITIPKGYVFILIGMLGIGGLMIFIADSIQTRKRRKTAMIQRGVMLEYRVPARNGVPVYNGVSMKKGGTADNFIKAFKMQPVFEAFVVTLFDPLYFRYSRPKAARAFAGQGSEHEAVPDLEFEFSQKETQARFAIKCLYYKNGGRRELQLFSASRQRAFREFEEDREMDLYYILGIGGYPDDPKELYLVPSKAITSEFVRKEDLRRYGKSGMFFYSSAARRLQ